MKPISFTIPVVPVSLQNSGRRVCVMGGRAIFYKDQKAKDWIKVVGFYANQHQPSKLIEEPVRLTLTFVMKRPVALNAKKFSQGRIPADKRPDTDNLSKCLTDALVGFWDDDARICELRASKYFAGKTEMPHIEVTIEGINPNTHTHESDRIGVRSSSAGAEGV
jgi:Holliday junction resolvase RusA-like endonuclease